VAKTVVDLGIEDDVVLAGVNWALDTSVALLGQRSQGSDGLPSTNGYVGSLPFLWYSERGEPGIQLILEQAEVNGRGLTLQNVSYILGWGLVDQYIEIYTQLVNEAGSLEAVDGVAMKALLEGIDYSPLGLYRLNFDEGARSVTSNRMAVMYYLNATMDGPATSVADALLVDTPDGGKLFVPLIVPVTPFSDAPDLRPGGADVPME
jgi:hypothetical protein